MGLGRIDLNLPAFERRLDRGSPRPIAVAYSGGGDSLAALVATKLWADRAGRPVVAIHLDHQLQPASGAWARLAEQMAAELGAGFVSLAWTGDKPRRGVAAAARRARHALVAEAARAAGARVVVFGHTADDILEAELMRAEGSSLGWLEEWRPSPAWPEGRDLFLLRPLLALRRAEVRRRLAPLGLTWIEDPANADPASARARARLKVAASALEPAGFERRSTSELADLARSAVVDEAGALTLERARLAVATPQAARRFLSAALTCVGGGDRPPRRERLDALVAHLTGEGEHVATLVGVRVQVGGDIRLVRETGSYRRHGAPEIRLTPGQTVVWDGRFEFCCTGGEGLSVRPLAGIAAKLSQKQKDRLALLPADVRGGLPALISANADVTCPILANPAHVVTRCLVAQRLYGACGMISQELRT